MNNTIICRRFIKCTISVWYITFQLPSDPIRLRLHCLSNDSTGVSALEFAIISPVLLTILLGMFQFGSAINDYLVLTNAAAKGALTIALGRGTATPHTTTISAITAAAPNVPPASITTTVTINGTACSTDAACTPPWWRACRRS